MDAIRINAVYPDKLADRSDLDFDGKDNGGSLLAAKAAADKYIIGIKSERVDAAVDKNG